MAQEPVYMVGIKKVDGQWNPRLARALDVEVVTALVRCILMADDPEIAQLVITVQRYDLNPTERVETDPPRD